MTAWKWVLILVIWSASGFCGAAGRLADAMPATRPAGAPTVFEMRVRAIAATRPALQARLLPDRLDQTPGNGATDYLLALTQMQAIPSTTLDLDPAMPRLPAISDKVDLYLEQGLDQLDVKGATELIGHYDGVLSAMDRAGRREQVDWGLPLREEGFHTLMPHLNGLRQLARILRLRTRLEIQRRDYHAALQSIQSGLAISQALNHQSVIVQALVGAGIARLFIDEIREMSQQPGAPNLYWALADLPRPFIDMRGALATERAMLFYTLPELRKATAGTMTADDWQAMQQRLSQLNAEMSGSSPSPLIVAAAGAATYPEAKKYLLAHGMTQEQVATISPPQAVGRYWAQTYAEWWDEISKWYAMPFWEAQPRLMEVERAFSRAESKSLNPLLVVVPAVTSMYAASVAVDREIAALRTVEALRDYAAGHEGKLPENLNEANALPWPIDPMTGKVFGYKREGKNVTLEAPVLDGVVGRYWHRYEVTVEK